MPGSGTRALVQGDEQDHTLVWHHAVRGLDVTRLWLTDPPPQADASQAIDPGWRGVWGERTQKRLQALAWRCAGDAHARLDYCADAGIHALRVFFPTRTIPLAKRWGVRWHRGLSPCAGPHHTGQRMVSDVEVAAIVWANIPWRAAPWLNGLIAGRFETLVFPWRLPTLADFAADLVKALTEEPDAIFIRNRDEGVISLEALLDGWIEPASWEAR